MNDADPTTVQSLSAAGAARRDALRSQLVARVRGRGRRRRGAQVLLLAAVVVLAYHAVSPVMPNGRLPAASRVQPQTPVAAATPTWRIVRDDPAVLSRYTAAAVPSQVEFLDDAGLRKQLAHAGRQSALARVGERVLVLAPVDDWRVAP